MPLVCLLAGVLLATTHGVSGGSEIRRSDSPRLVDLVREAQQSVDRLSAERDALAAQVDAARAGPASNDSQVAALLAKAAPLAVDAGLPPVRGPGLVVTLTDAQRDANGRFPRDASPDDLVVHEQDVQAVLNALWSGKAEAVQMQDQRLIATSAVRLVENTLLLNGRTYTETRTAPTSTVPLVGVGRCAAWPMLTSAGCSEVRTWPTRRAMRRIYRRTRTCGS